MKIEKISDNQIRCTLTPEDLADKKFKHLSGLTVISFSRKLGEEVKVKFFWSGIDS